MKNSRATRAIRVQEPTLGALRGSWQVDCLLFLASAAMFERLVSGFIMPGQRVQDNQ